MADWHVGRVGVAVGAPDGAPAAEVSGRRVQVLALLRIAARAVIALHSVVVVEGGHVDHDRLHGYVLP